MIPSWRCARMHRTIRPCHSVYTNGTPLRVRASWRSKWSRSMRIVARTPRMAPPTAREAARWRIKRGGRRSSRLPARRLPLRAFHEVRRDLLVHARNHVRNRLHALREDGDHEVRAVRQRDPADEVVEVVRVAGLRPQARALRQLLAGETRVLLLHLLELLLPRDVAREEHRHLRGVELARHLAVHDLLEQPRGLHGGHAIAVLASVAEGRLAAVGVLA